MPTLEALAGIHTISAGIAAPALEAAPTYEVRLVSMLGSTVATLINAEPETVTWTLNQPDEAHVHFPKNAYADTDIDALLAQAGAPREIQLYRNGDLLTWGPIVGVDAQGARGDVGADVAGVDWYLNRRFLDGTIPNLITNADFESGTAGWNSNCTFTIQTDTFVTGGHSAKLTNTVTNADAFINQSVVVNGAAIGRLMTLSAWVYIDSFTGPAAQTRGLYMEGRLNGVFQVNNNTGPCVIDNASPPERDKWTKLQTTIWVPPGQTWTINVRLYAPNGVTRWDDVKLVAMDSLATADYATSVPAATDIGYILSRLVQHVQTVSIGKSPLYIGDNCATTGTKMIKVYQFVDHVQFDQAVRELQERIDGADTWIDYTPTTRTYTSAANKRGTDLTGSVTLKYDVADQPGSNCTDYRLKRDGSQCITRQTMLGEDNGPAREQGEAADPSFVGGMILQDVRQAPHDTETGSLTPLADERIVRFADVPVSVEMDVVGGAGFIPVLKCGDLVSLVVNDGFAQINAAYRIMRISLNCTTNVQTVTVTKDSL